MSIGNLVNVPNGTNINFDFKLNDITYTFTLKYLSNTGVWNIRLQWESDRVQHDTYPIQLTTGFGLFSVYRNLLPVCFFCETINREQPLTADAFEKKKAFLKCCKWEEVKDFLAEQYDN